MRKFLLFVVFIIIGLFITGCEPLEDAVYRVLYYGNGNTSGFAHTDDTEYKAGMEATILDENTLLKTGFTFKCWNTNKTGTGTSYNVGDKVEIIDRNIFLYAVWE